MRDSFAALDWALALIMLSSLGSGFVLCWAYRLKRRKLHAYTAADRPPISVLKPLCGLDEGLYDNLISFLEQDYPAFELVLGVADPRDPVLGLVERLRRAHPHAPLRLVVHGEDDPGANPKVVSLIHMLRHASHELILVSDSNVRAQPGYLRAVAAEMDDPRVGLVSNLIVGTGDASLGDSWAFGVVLTFPPIATAPRAAITTKPASTITAIPRSGPWRRVVRG